MNARTIAWAGTVTIACGATPVRAPGPPPPAAPVVATVPRPPTPEVVTVDTAHTTTAGHRLIVPAGWSVRVVGRASILEAPEGGSFVAVVDTTATTADAALAEAWITLPSGAGRKLLSSTAVLDKDGWRDQRSYVYQTSPEEHRAVIATTMRHATQARRATPRPADRVYRARSPHTRRSRGLDWHRAGRPRRARRAASAYASTASQRASRPTRGTSWRRTRSH